MFGVYKAIDFGDSGFLRILVKVSPPSMFMIEYALCKHRLEVNGQKAFLLTARNVRKISLTFFNGATANETLSQSIITFCA